MINYRISFLPNVSDSRGPDELLWECHTPGSDLGTDGVSGEATPALLNSVETLAGLERNEVDRSGRERVTLMVDEAGKEELDQQRSPVEEAGQEVEGIEDEELCSTVEEGEEAALALDVQPNELELPWTLNVRSLCGRTEAGHKRSVTQDTESHEQPSTPTPEHQASEASSTVECAILWPSAQSDSCQSNNLAWDT